MRIKPINLIKLEEEMLKMINEHDNNEKHTNELRRMRKMLQNHLKINQKQKITFK